MSKLQELIENYKTEFSILTKEEIDETYEKYRSMYREEIFPEIIEAAKKDEMLLVRGYETGPEFTLTIQKLFNLSEEYSDKNFALSCIIESAIYDAFFDQFESGKFSMSSEEIISEHDEKDNLSKHRKYNSIYLDGNFKWYHDDGSLISEGIFDLKNDNYERKYYHKNGNLKCHVKFDKYGVVKDFKDFDESGNMIIIEENRYF